MRREAQKTGEILAVEGIAGDVVDLSALDGAEYARRNSLRSVDTSMGEKKTSYFFPDDPEKPAWKPVSMRWPYITMLIVIALLLAGSAGGVVSDLATPERSRHPDQGLIVFTDATSIPTITYFAWKYLPHCFLVTYGVMFQVVDFEVKRLDPYYQFSKRRGATAADTHNLDYQTLMSYLIPILAVKRKQWAVLCSSMATLIAGSVVPVLLSASVIQITIPAPAGSPTKKVVLVDPVWSRCLTASLGLVAVLGLMLMVFLRRKSGLLSDPKGIAGVASMATKSHILAEFKNLDTKSNEEVHRQLRKRRYNLHKSSLWQGEYITTATRQVVDKPENPVPFMLRLLIGIPFIISIVLFGLLLPFILFGPGSSLLTRAPWLLTAAATGIKLMWNTLDISVRVVEPYYILSRRHAPPKTPTLDYTGTVPGHLSAIAGRNGHWLVAAVGLGAIFSEILTVCVTSFKAERPPFYQRLVVPRRPRRQLRHERDAALVLDLVRAVRRHPRLPLRRRHRRLLAPPPQVPAAPARQHREHARLHPPVAHAQRL